MYSVHDDFYRPYNLRKEVSSVKTIQYKNAFAVNYLAQFLGPIDAKNIFCVWLPIQFKKVHNILLYDAGQFNVKNKMAAE